MVWTSNDLTTSTENHDYGDRYTTLDESGAQERSTFVGAKQRLVNRAVKDYLRNVWYPVTFDELLDVAQYNLELVYGRGWPDDEVSRVVRYTIIRHHHDEIEDELAGLMLIRGGRRLSNGERQRLKTLAQQIVLERHGY